MCLRSENELAIRVVGGNVPIAIMSFALSNGSTSRDVCKAVGRPSCWTIFSTVQLVTIKSDLFGSEEAFPLEDNNSSKGPGTENFSKSIPFSIPAVAANGAAIVRVTAERVFGASVNLFVAIVAMGRTQDVCQVETLRFGRPSCQFDQQKRRIEVSWRTSYD